MMAKVKAVKKDQIFDHIRAEQRAMTRARCLEKKIQKKYKINNNKRTRSAITFAPSSKL
jgi:hypothetical protein